MYVAFWNNDVVDIYNSDAFKDGSIDLQFDTWGSLTSIDIYNGVLYGSMQNRLYVRSADLNTKVTASVIGPVSGFGNNDIIVWDKLVYIVNYAQNAVIVYNSDSGKEVQRFTTEGLTYPQDAAFDNRGNLHVVGTRNKQVYVFDTSGNVLSTYGNDLLKEPFGIFIDVETSTTFVADRTGHYVFIYDASGDIRAVHTYSNAVSAVAFVPRCKMWVAAPSNKTILVY